MVFKRNLSSKIDWLLKQFPIVVILGSRQAGKTTLVKMIRPDWIYIDLENPQDFNRLNYDPLFFFEQYPHSVIIDEAQSLPTLFNTLRGIIDSNRLQTNRFLLTGSASPLLLKSITETLAGRVAIVELDTLKANEHFQQPLSPFYHWLTQSCQKQDLSFSHSPLTSHQIQLHWLYGGYPEPILRENKIFYDTWMENYRRTYLLRDLSRFFPRLNQQNFERFLYILGRLSGTIINKSEIARSLEISESAVRDYFAIAEGLYLWRNRRSYDKQIQKQIIKMPRGHIRDTGLMHFLLQIDSTEKLLRDPIIGHSFEAFVVEELYKGLQATHAVNWDLYYYRTRAGSEIDIIIDGPFGTLPIEVKYGVYTPIQQLKTLQLFLKDRQLSCGLLINQGSEATWLTPDIYQLPIGFL